MASSSIIPKPSYHARSISLPSRLHPVAEQLDQQLCRLRSSMSVSTSSSTLLIHRLNCLKDLYLCVDEFLHLPLNQHAKCLEEILDRSLRLLDICTASRDLLVISKQNLRDFESALRRKCGGEFSIASVTSQYLNTRKTIKKTVKKCLLSVKPARKNEEGNDDIITLLTDIESMTLDTFKSLLSYIGGSTTSRWSLVAKLVHQRPDDNVGPTSEFEVIDATISSFSRNKKNHINASTIDELRSQIGRLEVDIEEIDEIMECLFRHLVKTRASLLNIISN